MQIHTLITRKTSIDWISYKSDYIRCPWQWSYRTLKMNSRLGTVFGNFCIYQRNNWIRDKLESMRHFTRNFSCNTLVSTFSLSMKTSKEAIDAMASLPMYSSKSSLPKSMAKIAAGSIIESLIFSKRNFLKWRF